MALDKSALRTFATKARNELLERVELEARKIGITKDKIKEATIESSDAVFIHGKPLSKTERNQRDQLIARIDEISFERVMEEAAYTWFNRLIALRFMEVNDYLPTRVRVLSSEDEDRTDPDMITEALTLDLDMDHEYVYELTLENKTDELFKYLIKRHCDDLSQYMPFMFGSTEDYTSILFPEGLLGADSFVREMTDPKVIPEEDWKQVEIIGWLYQYYIAEEKSRVFKDFKKNIKVTKDTLPAATQLFTSNWIVKYMVENSLGKLWIEREPKSRLKEQMKYFVKEDDQEKEAIDKLRQLKYTNVNPMEIKFLDPACGSGHILIYAFDLFYEMYLEKGYVKNEIPKLIIEHNLYGLDIDQRATQLAAFTLFMKAREKSRRIFRNPPKLNILALQDTKWLTKDLIDALSKDDHEVKKHLWTLKDRFEQVKEYGSLLQGNDLEIAYVKEKIKEKLTETADLFTYAIKEKIQTKLPKLLKQVEWLNQTYDIVCTNPPYMGRNHMNQSLVDFLDQYYPEANLDLFAAFIERSFSLAKKEGFISMITMESWMFLSSYQKLREKIIQQKTLLSLIHMPYEGRGRTSLGINFGTTAMVLRNSFIPNYLTTNMYIRHTEIDEDGVPLEFPVVNERYNLSNVNHYHEIPGHPIAYWVKDGFMKLFQQPSIKENFTVQEGLKTGHNDFFIKKWYEINVDDSNIFSSSTNNKKWIKHTKGGAYRKWYGNNEDLLFYEDDGAKLKEQKNASLTGVNNYLKENVTWTRITSAKISFRYTEEGSIPNMAGLALYGKTKEKLTVILAYLNSKIAKEILSLMNPTINYSPGLIARLPFPTITEEAKGKINQITENCISISKRDWNSYETSWDFTKHPFLNFPAKTIESSFKQWEELTSDQFYQLKENEEELNRIFIDMYGLQDELTPEVKEEEVTVRKANLERDVKNFISYAVGCMFGRYSLDEEGLVYAGGAFDPDRYQTFPADENNVIPIVDGIYFEDDIVSKFVKFVEVTYGKENVEENLRFIAEALTMRKTETPRERIRRYFITQSQFYQDHVRTYKRTPIYWLFTSGRERAFNCLIYMHRYDHTTLSRIRTDYLHEVQLRYEAERQELQSIAESDASAKEIREARRKITVIDRKLEELKKYDEKLGHLADQQIKIDLDDGVKENYKKFDGLLARL